MASKLTHSTDSPQAEYEAKRLATQINLRKYYNRCVSVMAQEEAGELTIDEALDKFLELDSTFSEIIVDDIAPLKRIIGLA